MSPVPNFPPPRRAVLVLPMIPAALLLLAVFLPFVNTGRLWFGMPALFVWTSVGVLLITPALFAVEHLWSQRREQDTDQEATR